MVTVIHNVQVEDHLKLVCLLESVDSLTHRDVFPEPPAHPLFKTVLVGATYLTALLMISTIRYPSLKQLDLGQGKSHLVILTLATLVAGIFFYSRYALLILAYSYLLSGPLARMYQFSKYRFRHTRRVASRDRPIS